jgi:acyl carrier protein
MQANRIREVVLAELARIAPEADLTILEETSRFRDQLNFDSIDCLNLMMAIEKQLGVKIPEADYPQLASLAGCLSYLGRR